MGFPRWWETGEFEKKFSTLFEYFAVEMAKVAGTTKKGTVTGTKTYGNWEV